jgi:5-methylthioribose kinase
MRDNIDDKPKGYFPLDVNTIVDFISSKKNISDLFEDIKNLNVIEVGDGHLNLVFFVNSKEKSICIK